MTNIGDHGLICAEAESYAAIPLTMQANARTTNSALIGVRNSLASYGSRYTFQSITTSSSTSGANSGTLLPDGTAATQLSSAQLGILAQGWYSASLSVSYQATGTVTALSYRRAVIQINSTGGTIPVPPTLFQCIICETGATTGMDSMNVNGWFYSDGVTTTSCNLYFGHGNTGSSVTVQPGAAFTVRYLASGRVI